MNLDDTIIAVSSAQGGSGVRAIVRLSGPGAWGVAGTVMAGDEARGMGWWEVVIAVDEIQVAGQVMMFRGPRSFTGQDVAELHVPNSPALVDLLMERLLGNAKERGVAARMAEPGEFSARAFFNGKIDLTEAEGIAATINATNETQLRAAAGLREGDLHRWTQRTAEELANLLALVEAGIDFADEEDIRFIDTERLRAGIDKISSEIRGQLGSAVRIDRLAALPTVVLVGMPNVGKSSLINALAGVERSIVSAVAGTTRDILSAEMETPGGRVRLMDVPGEELPTDELRRKMMAAREGAMLEADLIVEVVDATGAAARDFEATAGRIRIQNKADLLSKIPVETEEAWRYVSAKTGLHLVELRAAIGRLTARDQTAGTSRLALNHRHRELLRQALDGLEAAGAIAAGGAVNAHPELLAAELRQALDMMGQITGTISPDDVLGRIFSTFCLGK